MTLDPFRHHPELTDLVADPEGAFLRNFSVEGLAKMLEDKGLPTGWWTTDEERAADRAARMAERPEGDLWIFGYGSLMWDPGLIFTEVRRAHVPTHERRFIVRDTLGGRGTPESPGLMAALDVGEGCDGLVFRIAEDAIEEETQILWRREKLAPAYHSAFVAAQTEAGDVTALTFVADHSADLIRPDISRADQVEYLAHGSGFLGTSVDYIRGIAEKFAALGVEDTEVTELLSETERVLAG